MARYSDNREEHVEVKYLYKVWSGVDKQIELPPTLTGRALLPKLDKVDQPVSLTRKIRFSPRIFTWQSSITYAAAFLLIVALSAAFGRSGNTGLEVLQEEVSSRVVMNETPENAATFSTQPHIAIQQEDQQQTAEIEASPDGGAVETGSSTAAEAAPSTEPVPSEGDIQQGSPQSLPGYESDGIGGQSASVLLREEEAYTYTYRVNDATDPDKVGYPITMNIMDSKTGELACSIDIPDMLTIEEYYLYGDDLSLVGSSENGVALHTYDISVMEEPASLFELVQPGEFLDAHLYKNVIHILTLSRSGVQLDCEVIELIGGTADTSCVITAIDMDSLETNRKAFSGAGADVVLYDLNAYLNYTGEATEGNEAGRYGAHIRLDGMEIELGNNS